MNAILPLDLKKLDPDTLAWLISESDRLGISIDELIKIICNERFAMVRQNTTGKKKTD